MYTFQLEEASQECLFNSGNNNNFAPNQQQNNNNDIIESNSGENVRASGAEREVPRELGTSLIGGDGRKPAATAGAKKLGGLGAKRVGGVSAQWNKLGGYTLTELLYASVLACVAMSVTSVDNYWRPVRGWGFVKSEERIESPVLSRSILLCLFYYCKSHFMTTRAVINGW